MTLLSIIVVVIVLILVFWLADRYVAPLLPPPWGRVVLAIIAIVVIIWLLSLAGILPALNTRVT